MVKHTNPKKDLSGIKMYNGSMVEVLPYFLYEVTIYKHWKNGAAQLGSRFFKTNKHLPIKRDVIIKRHDGYFIEKSITLLGVTSEFVRDNNISDYNPNTRNAKGSKNNTRAIHSHKHNSRSNVSKASQTS